MFDNRDICFCIGRFLCSDEIFNLSMTCKKLNKHFNFLAGEQYLKYEYI